MVCITGQWLRLNYGGAYVRTCRKLVSTENVKHKLSDYGYLINLIKIFRLGVETISSTAPFPESITLFQDC